MKTLAILLSFTRHKQYKVTVRVCRIMNSFIDDLLFVLDRSSGFPTRSDTNRHMQQHKMASSLNFRSPTIFIFRPTIIITRPTIFIVQR